MSRFRMALIGLAMAAVLLIPAAVAQAGPVRLAGPTLDGCPSGDVCMYTPAGWRAQQPEHEYRAYACYDLNNETGTRILANNQTGGATATGYDNYGCTAPAWTLQDHHANEYNITPINSISLNP